MDLISRIRNKINEEEPVDDSILKEIDWKGLEKHLSDILGVTITVKSFVKRSRFENYIKWEGNEDLVKDSGIFKAIFKSVKVAAFSTSTAAEVKSKNAYWCSISIGWDHKEGGSNGGNLGNAWYDLAKKTWTFKDVGA